MNGIPSTSIEPKKKAFGLFPRLSLSKTLELANTIYAIGEGEPVRRRTAFDRMAKSPDSGGSRVLVVASNSGYGLTNGGNQAEYLSLTERGRQITAAQDLITKFEGIYEALFSNDIFSGFIARFSDRGVPIDEVAVEYLRANHTLSQQDAQACWTVFKENLVEQNLIEESSSGKRVVISREAALEKLGKRPEKKIEAPVEDRHLGSEEGAGPVQQNPEAGTRVQVGRSETMAPQIHFNIQVVIPENASPGTYEAIFKSIATHLLNRESG